MVFNMNNPWLVGIIGGAIGAVLAGIILYYLLEYPKLRSYKTIITTSLNNADRLLEKNMTEDALKIYHDILKAVSEKKEPKLYSHIKSNEGICYYNLAIISNKEDNLSKAIQAYEQALKISTVEKYPLYHMAIMSNMERTKHSMKQ